MDNKNIFHTRATYNLIRLDYLVALAIFIGMAIAHWGEIRWARFWISFWWIDVVGYIPGAIYFHFRTSGNDRRIPTIFHILYNTTHSFFTEAVVAWLWSITAGGWEWAMLALPIHLLGDRSLFGNIYKPFGLSFEPVIHPLFDRFATEFRGEAT